MKKEPLTVIILAAGRGTRMKSLKPKVLHELAGLPMINWLIKTADTLSPKDIIVVIAPDMDDVTQAVAPYKTAIQKDPNGTGGAVRAALKAYPDITENGGDVMILLGDAPLITADTMKNLLEKRRSEDSVGISVLGVHLQNPTGYGRLVTGKAGYLDKIVEHKDCTDTQKEITLINTGAFCVDADHIKDWTDQIDNKNAQNEFYITDLPEIAAAAGFHTKIAVTDDIAEVKGCNSRTQLAALESIAQERLREKIMDGGVTMQAPETVTLSHDTVIGEDSFIEPHVVFAPNVKLGKNVRIRAFSYLEGTTVKERATIGPYARIRPQTTIGKGAKIGNFVEIKKSKIGDGSKIGHLAYIGDTEMGKDVNFSAGAITANYDGFKKYKTVIEDDAMIGANVNLVAPVTIGKEAFIAAGSTITQSIPSKALAVAREKIAFIKENWFEGHKKKNQKASK